MPDLLIDYTKCLKGMNGMNNLYIFSEEQEREIDKRILAAADSYAKCLMTAIRDAIAIKNTNNLLTEPDEENKHFIKHTYFYEKASYIRGGIIELAEEITEEQFTTYNSFAEHLLTFETYVNQNMEDGWTFNYGENDDVIAIKTEVKEHVKS